MLKKLSSLVFIIGIIFSNAIFAAQPNYIRNFVAEIDPLDKMPILEPDPIGVRVGEAPIEQRGIEFRQFLSASVKISVNGASGSGTIVYYDKAKNLAYVASCGHMWSSGVVSAEDAKKKNITCKVITWYHNEEKLDKPRTYNANVMFYSYIPGVDTSLITFTPDWEPNYFPLAPANYEYVKGLHVHSLGCDGGNEVAHYDIEIIGLYENDLVTYRNSPRPGRSGGGLMDDHGYYIGTCWGTQYRDGSGKGYFTPLSAIHGFWGKQKGFEFLLDIQPLGTAARKIPIIDRSKEQRVYKPEYILLPMR